jgi:amino acid transporter
LLPGASQRIVSALGWRVEPHHAGFVCWVVLLVALSTWLNLRGIKWTTHANQVMTALMFLVITVFVVDAVRFIVAQQGTGGLFSSLPFYNPATFNLRAVGGATSVAALTYIGFDGITTLAEDVREPKRCVPLAILIVCVLIGLCAFLLVYLAQLAWPDYAAFADPDTAFFDVCSRVGGQFLFDAMTVILAVACLGSALTGQVGAARILFGMGRDNALPRFLARLDRRNNPALNIWLIGIVVLTASLTLKYEDDATIINFGAFLAFMGSESGRHPRILFPSSARAQAPRVL